MHIRPSVAAAIDLAVIVTFVAIGRRNHDETAGIAGLVETAAPFVVGAIVGWAVMRAWREPAGLVTGVGVWIITLVGGMATRRWIFDDGTAWSFVIVAAAFLALTLIGWRAVARSLVGEHRAP